MELPEHLAGVEVRNSTDGKLMVLCAIDPPTGFERVGSRSETSINDVWANMTEKTQAAVIMASISQRPISFVHSVRFGDDVTLWGDGEIWVRQEGVKRDAATQ